MHVKSNVLLFGRTGYLYRFLDFIPACISVYRYATLALVSNWRTNVHRLRVAKGLNQGELADAAGIRPNTLSAALSEVPHENTAGEMVLTEPRIDTVEAIAKGLGVPLWALFCSEEEYGLFTNQVKQADAYKEKARHRADLAALVDEKLAPIRDAMLAQLTGQPLQVPGHELAGRPVLAHSAPVPAHKHGKKKIRA